MAIKFDISIASGAAAVAVYPPGASYGPRTLSDFEFVWMIEGNALYSCDGQTIEAPAESIVLCRPGVTDTFRWDEKHRTRHAFFHFKIEKIPEQWGAPETWPIVRQLPEDDIIRSLFRHILAWDGSPDNGHYQITIAHTLSAFIGGRTAASQIGHEVWPEAVQRAWDSMFHRLEESEITELSLEELARIACLSPEHLCRIFKTTTGYSPLEAWRLARLDKSLTLLLRSNYSMAQIATFCGFASPFHYSRRFKEVFGRAPSDMRAAVRNGDPVPAHKLVRRQRISAIK